MVRKHAVLLVLFLLAACSAKSIAPDTPAEVDPREQELRAVVAEAEPLVRNLLTALNAGDYAAYSRDFDDTARKAVSEEQFKIFYEDSCKKKLGPYEEGRCQVNKIEKHPDFYMIYYFVKFRNVTPRDPVLMNLKVVKTPSGLKVSGLAYRHAGLETQQD